MLTSMMQNVNCEGQLHISEKSTKIKPKFDQNTKNVREDGRSRLAELLGCLILATRDYGSFFKRNSRGQEITGPVLVAETAGDNRGSDDLFQFLTYQNPCHYQSDLRFYFNLPNSNQ
jgi:hypothetical protein